MSWWKRKRQAPRPPGGPPPVPVRRELPLPESFKTYPDGTFSGTPPDCVKCGQPITIGVLKMINLKPYHGACTS